MSCIIQVNKEENMKRQRMCGVSLALAGLLLLASAPRKGIKVFISVDMEGIGGVGSPLMTSATSPESTSRAWPPVG